MFINVSFYMRPAPIASQYGAAAPFSLNRDAGCVPVKLNTCAVPVGDARLADTPPVHNTRLLTQNLKPGFHPARTSWYTIPPKTQFWRPVARHFDAT